jgi:hypothetical protein
LIEGAIELEAGAHRSGRRVRGDIDVEIGLRDRRRVEDAGVDEGLQVLALAPSDEHLRHVAGAVEGEVPDTRVGSEPIEDGRPRERGVHDDQVGDLVAIRLGVGVGNHQTDVVADERDRVLDSNVLAQQSVDVDRHGALVVAAGRPPRVSGAPVVGCDYSEAGVDERRNDVTPLMPGLREPVQEHDGAPSGARRDVVQAQSGLDVGHAMRQFTGHRVSVEIVLFGSRGIAFAADDVQRDIGLFADDPTVMSRWDIEEVTSLHQALAAVVHLGDGLPTEDEPNVLYLARGRADGRPDVL